MSRHNPADWPGSSCGLLLAGLTVAAIILVAPLPVYAAHPMAVAANEPFALVVSLPAATEADYSLKFRLFDPVAKEHRGETWNGTAWLRPTASWELFPHAVAGTTVLLIGRTNDLGSKTILQVAVRRLGTEKTEVIEEHPIDLYSGIYPLELAAHHPATGERLKEGYFRLDEEGRERLIPLVNEDFALTRLAKPGFRLSFFATPGSEPLVPPKLLALTGQGVYRLILNEPPAINYTAAIEAPALARPGEAITLRLVTTPNYLGPVVWYSDGEKVATITSPNLSQTFPKAGIKQIEAIFADGRGRAQTKVIVESYPAVRLKEVLANPAGRDIGSEKVTLQNGNHFPVTIKGWQLRSRSSRTAIRLDGMIAPLATLTVTTSNKIVNRDGAYDLFNESGELVDTLFYPLAPEGIPLVRQGLLWQPAASQSPATHRPKASGSDDIQAKRGEIEGRVIKPRGRTIDLATTEGEVRLVVHKTFNQSRPRLHAGDLLRASGTWQVSRRGPYLSLRSGDTLALVGRAPAAARVKAKRSPPYIARAAAPSAGQLVVTRQLPLPQPKIKLKPPAAPASSRPPPLPPSPIPLVFALIITFGVVLVLPSRRPSVG